MTCGGLSLGIRGRKHSKARDQLHEITSLKTGIRLVRHVVAIVPAESGY